MTNDQAPMTNEKSLRSLRSLRLKSKVKIDAPNLNHLWAQLMIEELIRNGVTHFFVAPGSRSSPLALAVAGNPRAQMTVHFDERGLAFAALGCARATGILAVVITTSGTAVANLFPAVVEASMDHVPMILLTGDRPPELRDCGANQAIDQVKIFGDYVRWFFDVPCPDEKISPRFVLTTIDQAVARSASGPVHLNCQFREPLAPLPSRFDRKKIVDELQGWLTSSKRFTDYASTPQANCPIPLLDALQSGIKGKGLIVVGSLAGWWELEPVMQLAQQLGWPVVADIRSGLRGIRHVVNRADHLLLSERFKRTYKPEIVLQFGSRLVSKRIQQWIDSVRPRIYALISPGLDRLDAGMSVTHRWAWDFGSVCRSLQEDLPRAGKTKWMKSWQQADATAEKALGLSLAEFPLSEPWISNTVTALAPCDQILFFASSMPVRDAEMFAPRTRVDRVLANRGASGIDGTVATACGACFGSERPVTLVIGDLALLHDLNSLALVRETKKPFVIVAINNDGGAIFSFLPVAQFPKHFEKVFGTPHGLGFKSAAEMFGIAYENPTTAKDFELAYRDACGRNGATLIEVRTNREENLRIHREIQDAARKAVDRVVR